MRTGWKSLRPFAREAIRLALFCALLVGCNVVVYNRCRQCYEGTDLESHEVNWYCRFLNDPNAVFTAASVALVIIGFWYIRKQIDQTDRSQELSLLAERGDVVITRCNVTSDNRVAYTVRNVGARNSLCQIVSCDIQPMRGLTSAEHPIIQNISDGIFWNEYLTAGEEFSPGNNAGFAVPKNCFDKATGMILPLVIQMEVRHITLQKTFIHHCSFIFGPNNLIARFPEPTHVFDRPVNSNLRVGR